MILILLLSVVQIVSFATIVSEVVSAIEGTKCNVTVLAIACMCMSGGWLGWVYLVAMHLIAIG